MNIEGLEIDDYIIINEIVKVTYSLYENFMRLYSLDREGKKNSKEYHIRIRRILDLSHEEQTLYSELKLDTTKSTIVLGYISSKYFGKSKINDDIIYQEETMNIFLRIINMLNSYILIDYSYYDMSGFEILISDLSGDGFNRNDLVKAFEMDYYLKFIQILDDFEKNCEFKIISKEIMKAKYLLSFTNKDVGFRMIEGNFEIEKDNLYQSQWLANLFGIRQIDYNTYSTYFGVNELDKNVNYLLDTNEAILKYKVGLTTFIIRQALIRASLLFIDDLSKKRYIHEFYKFINNQKNNESDPVFINAIKRNFKLNETDQKIFI